MWLQLILTALLSLLTAIVGYVLLTAARSYKAHQFFKLKSPNLPILPDAQLFGGHLNLMVNPRNWLMVDNYHKKYGKTFAFYYCDTPCVFSIDLDLIKTYVLDEPEDHNNKGYSRLPYEELKGDTLLIGSEHTFRRMRKAIAPAFTSHKIKSSNLADEFYKSISRFIESLERRSRITEERGLKSFQLDVSDTFQRFALDISLRTFFNEGKLVDFDAKDDYWRNLIHESIKPPNLTLLKLSLIFPIINWCARQFSTYFTAHSVYHRKVRGLIENQFKIKLVSSKMSKTQEANQSNTNSELQFKQNITDYIIDHYKVGNLSLTEYINNTFFVFFASNVTTSDAFTRIIYHIALHQDVQSKLRESLLIDNEDSEYLSWCIYESMRLYPPSHIGSTRVITRDIQTKAGLVPKGTWVWTPAYTINRLEEYWGSDADKFKPERWKETKGFHPMQYITFGAGRRICPGKDFAMKEMKMLVTSLIERFTIELCPETTDETVREFQTPAFLYMFDDKPTLIRVRRLEKNRFRRRSSVIN